MLGNIFKTNFIKFANQFLLILPNTAVSGHLPALLNTWLSSWAEVGYGDIYAHTPTEMGYAIVIMFMGAQFFGYIVGSIAGLSEKSGDMQATLALLVFQPLSGYALFPPESNVM